MTDEELKNKLDSLRNGMKWFEGSILPARDGEGCHLTNNQYTVVNELFKLFNKLDWQLHLNSYKELKVQEDRAVRPDERCGRAVKVSPCGKEYEGKTFFGIYLGDVALAINASIDKNETLVVGHSFYNPAILIPELGKIVYGAESWWDFIKEEEDLKKVITEETIKNVWYVQILNSIGK